MRARTALLAAAAALLVAPAAATAAPPTCTTPTFSQIAAGQQVAFTPPCTDPENDPLTYELVKAPEHGTLTGPNAQNSFTYTARFDYEGNDTIQYVAHAGGETSSTATHTISITNQAPNCISGTASVKSGETLTVPNLCSDPEGGPVTVTVVQPPAHGKLAGPAADGSFTYTPDPGFSGQDTVRYQASDGLKTSSVATGTINVLPVQGGGGQLPPPVVGVSVNVVPVSGTVLVRVPGERAFRRLRAGEQLPVGTTIDVKNGRIRLTSAANAAGGTQTSDFYGGRFRVVQAKAAKPVTELQLDSGSRSVCGSAARAAASQTGKKKRRKKVLNQLWGDGAGSFRTRGSYGSAAIRGTRWLTADRCDGTFVRVTQGVVSVRDFTRRRTILVRAPRSYLAPARRR